MQVRESDVPAIWPGDLGWRADGTARAKRTPKGVQKRWSTRCGERAS